MLKVFLLIVVVSVVTFILRAFPFVVFGGKKEIPQVVKYLGDVLPQCIMITLVVYCLKAIDITVSGKWVPELVSVIFVIFLHLWKKNTLLSIFFGTVLYMLLVQLVFVR